MILYFTCWSHCSVDLSPRLQYFLTIIIYKLVSLLYFVFAKTFPHSLSNSEKRNIYMSVCACVCSCTHSGVCVVHVVTFFVYSKYKYYLLLQYFCNILKRLFNRLLNVTKHVQKAYRHSMTRPLYKHVHVLQ